MDEDRWMDGWMDGPVDGFRHAGRQAGRQADKDSICFSSTDPAGTLSRISQPHYAS